MGGVKFRHTEICLSCRCSRISTPPATYTQLQIIQVRLFWGRTSMLFPNSKIPKVTNSLKLTWFSQSRRMPSDWATGTRKVRISRPCTYCEQSDERSVWKRERRRSQEGHNCRNSKNQPCYGRDCRLNVIWATGRGLTSFSM